MEEKLEDKTLFEQQKLVDALKAKYDKTSQRLEKKQDKYSTQDYKDDLAFSTFVGAMGGLCVGSFTFLYKVYNGLYSENYGEIESVHTGVAAGVLSATLPIIACVARRKLLKRKIASLEKERNDLGQKCRQEQAKLQKAKTELVH